MAAFDGTAVTDNITVADYEHADVRALATLVKAMAVQVNLLIARAEAEWTS